MQGFDKTFTQVEFAILLSFTKMNWMFGIKKRNLERITQEARAACADLREQRCMDRLDQSSERAIVKSLLINGKGLEKIKIILTKLAKTLVLQVQRLNEETRLWRGATVRTA